MRGKNQRIGSSLQLYSEFKASLGTRNPSLEKKWGGRKKAGEEEEGKGNRVKKIRYFGVGAEEWRFGSVIEVSLPRVRH